MPIREYSCECGHFFEELIRTQADEPSRCPQCDSSKIEKLPALIGGYQGSFGGGSTSPRQAGSFKNKKVIK